MTKNDLREEIAGLEPDNKAAKNVRLTREELMAELAACRRRKAASEARSASPVSMRYRVDSPRSSGEDGMQSWKFFDGDAPVSGLNFGEEMPMEGDVVDDGLGNPLRIVSVSDGLEIMSDDLPIRENFDPRRIYTTQNGTAVTFKRVEGALIVLWSYKIGGEIAIGPRKPMNATERVARPTASTQRKATQKDVAAYVIAQNPEITPDELNVILRDAFPQSRIVEGGRHGGHYLSLSRNGHLPEPSETDPRTWGK